MCLYFGKTPQQIVEKLEADFNEEEVWGSTSETQTEEALLPAPSLESVLQNEAEARRSVDESTLRESNILLFAAKLLSSYARRRKVKEELSHATPSMPPLTPPIDSKTNALSAISPPKAVQQTKEKDQQTEEKGQQTEEKDPFDRVSHQACGAAHLLRAIFQRTKQQGLLEKQAVIHDWNKFSQKAQAELSQPSLLGFVLQPMFEDLYFCLTMFFEVADTTTAIQPRPASATSGRATSNSIVRDVGKALHVRKIPLHSRVAL